MVPATILAIGAAALAALAALVRVLTALRRRRRFRLLFGPEYERLAGEHDRFLQAGAESAGYKRWAGGFDIRPLGARRMKPQRPDRPVMPG